MFRCTTCQELSQDFTEHVAHGCSWWGYEFVQDRFEDSQDDNPFGDDESEGEYDEPIEVMGMDDLLFGITKSDGELTQVNPIGQRDYREFDSYRDALVAAEKCPVYKGRSSLQTETEYSWDLNTNLEEAIGLARHGWPEGMEKVETLVDAFYNQITNKARKPMLVSSVVGEAPNIGRYLAGHPQSMLRWHHPVKDARGKIVTILYNIAMSAGVRSYAIMQRGAAVCALTECLERSGKRCEVVLVDSNRATNGMSSEQRVTIKRADQPMQLDQMVFALVHPASRRRVLWAVKENWEEFGKTIWDGRTQPCEAKGWQGDIYVGEALWGQVSWNDKQECEKWIRQQLVMQGVEFD